MCAYQGVINVRLSENLALFSWNTRFEIHPFALLPRQWRIQRILDAGIPVWAAKLCAQIIEKCLK